MWIVAALIVIFYLIGAVAVYAAFSESNIYYLMVGVPSLLAGTVILILQSPRTKGFLKRLNYKKVFRNIIVVVTGVLVGLKFLMLPDNIAMDTATPYFMRIILEGLGIAAIGFSLAYVFSDR
jgi:hypothetical protein